MSNEGWQFAARFRKGAFGWRSDLPIQRIKEAVKEIKAAAKSEPVAAAEGAVLFLEKVSPAIANVDSSSGAIGGEVNHAVEELAAIIARAPADDQVRQSWLERLDRAYVEDQIPYLETIGEVFGEICQSVDLANRWAANLSAAVAAEMAGHRNFSKHALPYLSVLCAAGRTEELLSAIDKYHLTLWGYRLFGVKSLLAEGKRAEALRFAEASRSDFGDEAEIARTCEQILLDSGLRDEAYRRYGVKANRTSVYRNWFRAIQKKYPEKQPHDILKDLLASTPGEEGKWFAAARDCGLYTEAIELAAQSPCNPETLSRSAEKFRESEPDFACKAGLAALRWMLAGYGYELKAQDVASALERTIAAAETAGKKAQAVAQITEMMQTTAKEGRFARTILQGILPGYQD